MVQVKLSKQKLMRIIKEELDELGSLDKVRGYLMAGDAFTYEGFVMTPPRGLESIAPPEMEQILSQLEDEGKIEKAERGYFSVVQENITETMIIEELSDYLSNIYKWCPSGSKCAPEKKKTKWWKGR